MPKKYKIEKVYDFQGVHDPGVWHAVYLDNIPGCFVLRGDVVEVSSHRNISQLGTCSSMRKLSSRTMVFGDESRHRYGKTIDDIVIIYSRIFFSTKLARFVRS